MSRSVRLDNELEGTAGPDRHIDLRLEDDRITAERRLAEIREFTRRAADVTWTQRVVGLVRTARPKQWVKNILVFAAPAAAGVLTDPGALGSTLLAFLAFSLAASGTYCINDAQDREADRRHPRKCNRPVAAGLVSERAAWTAGALFAAGGVILAALTVGWLLATAVAGYLVLTTAYSTWLKHIAIIDIAAISAGFVIRAVGGAVAVGVPMSDWFLIVVSFGALFIAAGKRTAERTTLGDGRGEHRPTLEVYTGAFLRHVSLTATAVTIVAYCLWAFDAIGSTGNAWLTISIVPFVLGMLRYGLLVEHGYGEAPEEVVLGDRSLQAIGAFWALLFTVGVYAI